jgi:Ser-tRNA(Ala) deacylase AlaX
MKTTPIYLEDSYQKEMDASILDVYPESDGRWRVVLDQTVFYPMGGGQATDQGTLTSDTLHAEVYQVMMKDGEIQHFIKSDTEPLVGDKIHGVINWDRRYTNMKKHSAGHIVDFAMYQLGYSPKSLVPLKGDHDKKLSILYGGDIGKDIKQELEDKANELVAKDLSFSWSFEPFEKIQTEAIYLQPGLPTNKPLRMLRLEGVGSVADGGTQVHKTSEVGKITIPSIQVQDGNTLVLYSLT